MEGGRAGDRVHAVAERAGDRAADGTDEGAVAERRSVAGGPELRSDAIRLGLQLRLGLVVLRLRRAELRVLVLLGGRRRVASPRLFRGDGVQLGLLVGRGGARLIGHLLLLRDLRLLARQLVLQKGDATGVPLALVGDALEVVLALDQPTG